MQARDQEWDRGNLALRKACEQQVPVRVIRALPPEEGDAKSYSFDVRPAGRLAAQLSSARLRVWLPSLALRSVHLPRSCPCCEAQSPMVSPLPPPSPQGLYAVLDARRERSRGGDGPYVCR